MESNESNRDWAAAAKGLGLPILQERIDQVSPVLSNLFDEARLVLAEDLSLIEPIATFRPSDK